MYWFGQIFASTLKKYMQKEELIRYLLDLIIDAVKFIALKLGRSEFSGRKYTFSQLAEFARWLTDQDLKIAGISPKYRAQINRLREVSSGSSYVYRGDQNREKANELGVYLAW